MLVSEHGVHHVDLNFGCPVRKITARGGGSALPLRPLLFSRYVTADPWVALTCMFFQADAPCRCAIGITPRLKRTSFDVPEIFRIIFSVILCIVILCIAML